MREQTPPELGFVLDACNELAGMHAGLLVERKHAAVALHYRLAPQLEALCREALTTLLARQPQLELLHGKCVFEIKPAGMNKGMAIDAFLEEAPFAGRVPVFAGDDTTDETGFAVVQRRPGGMAIKVGTGPSQALHRLDAPAAVQPLAGQGARPAGRAQGQERRRPQEEHPPVSRLVVVSNRVADPRKPAAGGLAVALGESLQQSGGLWFGWSGTILPTAPPAKANCTATRPAR